MSQVIAVVITDLEHARLGLPSRVADDLNGRSVLDCTLGRLSQIKALSSIVVLHQKDQDAASLVQHSHKKPVVFHSVENKLVDAMTPMRQIARKWARHAWRGGLGGATCYDELLPAAPILEAVKANHASAALIVGGDWPLVDPTYGENLIQRHLEYPDALQMTFTQAPPGLSGIVVARPLLEQLVENESSSFGSMLAYNPKYPQADPIGRDLCVSIDPEVRQCTQRLIYDTQRSIHLIQAVDVNASAVQIVSQIPQPDNPPMPDEVTVELTPQRDAAGPLLPQHYVSLDREPMTLATAEKIFHQLNSETVVMFGGLGDALLHPQWDQIVQLAADCGVFGIGIVSDFLIEPQTASRLLELPVDVVCVRINADTAATYEKMMKPTHENGFKLVTDRVQGFLNDRNRRWQSSREMGLEQSIDLQVSPAGSDGRVGGVDGSGLPGVPWIVPGLVKTADTLKDMETFFDRWMHYTNHAMIEPATTGCGLMPALSPVPMQPPRRRACRQLDRRLTILSTGEVALCDQDWLCRSSLGNSDHLAEAWENAKKISESHRQEQWDTHALCASCTQWHRP